jgi:two-component system, NarL family, invasion response regulator UvrY
MIRVLVVDDHTLVRAGLCKLLEGEGDLEVIAQTGSGREAVQLCQEHKPDVVILDYNLPDQDGLATTEQIMALKLKTHVLVLTMYANEEYAIRVIRAGAAGFIIKGASTDELVAAVRKVASGGVHVSPAVQERMVVRLGHEPSEHPESDLSNRELQVLVRLSRGATTREVAEELCLSLSTVETYRSRILEKLGLRNNSDLTRFAVRRGLIENVE